jgi:hypothetical protein
MAGVTGQIRTGGRAIWQAVADANRYAPKSSTCVKRICRKYGRAELFSPLGEGPCRNRKTGYARFLISPGTLRAACQKRVVSESPEPLVGGLGRRDRHSEGVAYNRPMQGNCDVPASGADGADKR